MSDQLRLYSYFRSSCSYRVRIALNLKGLPYEYKAIHLLQDGGRQYSEGYLALNPVGEVPSLEILDENGQTTAVLAQSVAILEYLEEAYPEPALLPSNPVERAKVRQLVEIINSSIQPIQNLKVMRRLTELFENTRPQNFEWAAYWIERGFRGLEGVLEKTAGEFAFGDSVTLADVLLVPQAFNADRFGVDLNQMPNLQRAVMNARALPAFADAHPSVQPDSE